MLMNTLRLIPLLLALGFSFSTLAQNNPDFVDFSVMALDVDDASRKLLEDALVQRLQSNQYQAFPSYPTIPDVTGIDSATIKNTLSEAGMDAVLIIRPLDIGERATIESVQSYLAPENYRTISEFVNDYRGHNFHTQAVIHVVGYIFDETRSMALWQGVMWFDDEIHTVDEGVTKIVDMVEYNLNHYRPLIRQQLGLEERYPEE